MKTLITITHLLVSLACLGQEPTPFGFNFRVENNEGKSLNLIDLKNSGLQIFLTPTNNEIRKCEKDQIYSKQESEFTYDTLKKYFSFEKLYSPSERSEPSFIIIHGNDTMFIKLSNVLKYSSYQYLPNGSGDNLKTDYSNLFTIRFRKGYFIENTVVDIKKETRLVEYFENEIKLTFCYWIKVE